MIACGTINSHSLRRGEETAIDMHGAVRWLIAVAWRRFAKNVNTVSRNRRPIPRRQTHYYRLLRFPPPVALPSLDQSPASKWTSRLRIDDSSSAGNNSVDIGGNGGGSGGGGGIAVIFFVRYFVVDVFHAIAVAVGEERREGKERGGEGRGGVLPFGTADCSHWRDDDPTL